MTPIIHVVPAPSLPVPAATAFPALGRRDRATLSSGMILALLLLALLLQASFFVFLATGQVAGPAPGAARAALAR